MLRKAMQILFSVVADVRYALRGLRNTPGYAVTVILTLALGLGATTAMLAIADSVLLRPLDFPHPERVDSLHFLNGAGVEQWDGSWKNYEALRDGVKTFEGVSAYSSLPTPVSTAEGSLVKLVVHATPSLFEVAGVRPLMGRTLVDADLHTPVAVIGNGFWRDTLHKDPRVLGRSLRVEGRLLTIVGVMPAGFIFPAQSGGVAVYASLELDAQGHDSHGFDSFSLVVRRRAGVSRAIAESEAQAVQRGVTHPPHEKPSQLLMHPYLNSIVGEQQPALLALLAACALLLAISCVNAANLQIARGTLRAAEMTTRAALGAGRARLLRQIVTESITVSCLGAGLGLLLANGAVHAARSAYGRQFPRFDELALHPAVFACSALLAISSGALAALAPALGMLRGVTSAQRANSRTTTRARLSSVLVASEVGLTCLLLIGAGLFLRTFRALEQVPLGFNPAGATEMVLMPENPSQAAAAQQATYSRLIDRMEHLPGVSGAAFDTALPFAAFQMEFNGSFHILGQKQGAEQDAILHTASVGYFHAMQIPVREGRLFGSADAATSSLVGVVSAEFARKFLPGSDPLGKQVQFDQGMKFKQPVTIIGVVGDVLEGRDLTGGREPLLYLLPEQIPPDFPQAHFLFGIAPQFVVRSQLPQETLKRELESAIQSEAPGFAVMAIDPIRTNIESSLATRRLALRLASGFGIVALLLSAAGIYGVLAYTVAQRTREIGIRMALGSSRRAALSLVLRQAGVMCASGMVLGFAAVWPAARSIRSFLYGVPALDPLTLASVALLLALVCLLAAALPARRAAAVDPMQALRAE